MTSEVIGDTSHLHRRVVRFSAVHTSVGQRGPINFLLADCTGFSHLVAPYASVHIQESSLTAKVIGPASATVAVQAHIAVVPSTFATSPESASQVMLIGGSIFIQHSLFVAPTLSQLEFSPEASYQIKPRPVLGSLPRVLGHYDVVGGSAVSTVHVIISGTVALDGVGFVHPY